ncbi:MAG: polysaccharide deacetylase family protein [Actinobacteria bacterium]|nr:polysaccharide deacetylase family protein [Actinomycetota bacterium]
MDLPRAQFDAHMAILAGRGDAWTLDEALASLQRPDPPPRDPVVVTFDDGSSDFADTVVPIVVEHRIPVTLYLATGYVDEQRALPHGGRPLSWAALRDARSTGMVTVGSHTHGHTVLARVPASMAGEELDRSIELIGAHLGAAAEHFAYPKGLAGSPAVAAEVRKRFRSAALAGTRTNTYGATDPYRLHRSPVQAADGIRWFDAKLRGGMALEGDVRRALDRVRYARATT